MSLFPVEPYEIVETENRIGVLRAQLLPANLQCALKELLGLLVLLLRLVKNPQIVEPVDHIGVGRAEHLFADSQRLLQKWLGLFILVLGIVGPGQVVETGGSISMFGAEHLLTKRQRSLEKLPGLFILSLIEGVDRLVIEAGGSMGVYRVPCLPVNYHSFLQDRFRPFILLLGDKFHCVNHLDSINHINMREYITRMLSHQFSPSDRDMQATPPTSPYSSPPS